MELYRKQKSVLLTAVSCWEFENISRVHQRETSFEHNCHLSPMKTFKKWTTSILMKLQNTALQTGAWFVLKTCQTRTNLGHFQLQLFCFKIYSKRRTYLIILLHLFHVLCWYVCVFWVFPPNSISWVDWWFRPSLFKEFLLSKVIQDWHQQQRRRWEQTSGSSCWQVP